MADRLTIAAGVAVALAIADLPALGGVLLVTLAGPPSATSAASSRSAR